MGLTRKTFVWAVCAWALGPAPAAWAAAACISPKTPTEPIPYVSPPGGANFLYRIIYNPQSKTPDVTHQRYRVKSVNGDSVRWFREPVQGKGPIQDVTLYRAFARTAAGDGWEFNFDVTKFDELWPLRQGNEASYVAKAVKGGQLQFRLQASFCVRGSKVLKLLAGEFEGHLIDISIKVLEAPEDLAWDLAEINAWYVPRFGTALLMEDRITKKGKPVVLRRREAMEVPALDGKVSETAKEPAKEPDPPNFRFPGVSDEK